MKEALLILHPLIQIFHCKILFPCYNNFVNKIKYIIFMILFVTSSSLFAQSTLKQKTFGTFTIRFDTQKPELVITNATKIQKARAKKKNQNRWQKKI